MNAFSGAETVRGSSATDVHLGSAYLKAVPPLCGRVMPTLSARRLRSRCSSTGEATRTFLIYIRKVFIIESMCNWPVIVNNNTLILIVPATCQAFC